MENTSSSDYIIKSKSDQQAEHESIHNKTSVDYQHSGFATNLEGAATHQTLGQIAESFHEKGWLSIQSQIHEDIEEMDDDEVGSDDGELDHGAHYAESTGRWTRQEHELFLEALKKYGKEWKKVASMVKTRTVVQTRTHAQKYFQKLAKTNGGNFSTAEEVLGAAEKVAKRNTAGHTLSSSSKRSKKGEHSTPHMKGHTNSEEGYIPANYQEGYVPLEADSTTPFVIHGVRTSPQVYGSDMPTIQIPHAPKMDFLQPSPAATGRRKHAELTAAQMLAGSAQSRTRVTPNSSLDIEGAQVLSRLRDGQEGSLKRKGFPDLTLSIVDPNGLGASELNMNEPSTPWDAEIQALNTKSSRHSSSMLLSSSSDIRVNVTTPSEQKKFLHKVRSLVADANLSGLEALFQAAKTSVNDAGGEDTGNAYHEIIDKTDSNMVEASEADKTNDYNNGSRSEVAHLIKASLNRVTDHDQPVLHLALMLTTTQQTIYDIVKLLLEYGASAATSDVDQNTCLHLAAYKGYEKLGKLLLSKGCPSSSFNRLGDAAIHIAAKEGHGSFLEMLSSLGINFHQRNTSALSPLDLAGFAAKTLTERSRLRKLMLTLEPRLRSLILYHDDFLEHSARRPSDWEAPDRLLEIMRRVRDGNDFPTYEVEITNQFEKADVVLLGRVHSPDYLSFVNSLSKRVQQDDVGTSITFNKTGEEEKRPVSFSVPFTPQVQKFLHGQKNEMIKPAESSSDTSFSSGTLRAARRAAGAVAYAIDRVMLGRNRNAFCVVRPPGHHAGYRGLLDGANSCGFCIFNNVAAGALHALEDHQCERVAIVDLDIHHGNGTEDIVRRYPKPSCLFFFSLHLYDQDSESKFQFYPGTGQADDHVHNIINVPLTPLWKTPHYSVETTKTQNNFNGKKSHSSGLEESVKYIGTDHDEFCVGREEYRKAILQRLIPSLRAFNPSLILLSMGFDTLNGDVGNCKHTLQKPLPQKGMDLNVDDIAWVTTEVMKIADICCNGRLVSVLEGGYGQYALAPGHKSYSTRSSTVVGENPDPQIDANAVESRMNRSILAEAAAAHVRRLIDPQTYSSYADQNTKTPLNTKHDESSLLV